MSRIINKPEASERVLLPGEEIRNAELGFAFAEVTAVRQDNDLVLAFADGAQIIFANYFQIHDGNLPQLNFADGLRHLGPDDIRTDWERPGDKADGSPPASEQSSSTSEQSPSTQGEQSRYQQSSDAPASGPDSGQQALLETNYKLWEELELLDGRPHLGPLDLGWNRGWNEEFLYNGHGSWGSEFVSGVIHNDADNPNNAPQVSIDTPLPLKEAGVKDGGNQSEEGAPTVSGQITATDADNDTLTYAVKGSAQGVYGSLSLDPATGGYTYALDNGKDATQALVSGQSATESFTITVSDSRGGTAEQTITFTIEGSNDAPVLSFASGDGVHVLSGRQNGDAVSGALAVADPDSDGAPGQSVGALPSQQFAIKAGADTTGSAAQNTSDGSATFTTDKGILTVRPDGSYTFEYTGNKPVDADATLHFVVQTTDAHGAVSNEQDIVVTLTPNQIPIITSTEHSHTVKEAGVKDGGNLPEAGTDTISGRITATDADNDTLTYGFKTGTTGAGKYGTLTLNPDGSYSYRLDNSLDAAQKLNSGQTETETFIITVSDGQTGGNVEQTITIAVTGTNDAPVLSFAAGGDGVHALTDTGKAQKATGSFSVADADADGKPGGMVTVDGGSKASQSFSITGKDGTTGTVTPQNDGSVTFVTEYGTLTISKNGGYEYTLNPASEKLLALGDKETHTENFVVTVTDAHGAVSETLPISVELTGKNDPPKVIIKTSGDTAAKTLVEAGVHKPEGGNADPNTPESGAERAGGTLEATHTDSVRAGEGITYDCDANVLINGTSTNCTYSKEGSGVIQITTAYGTLTLTPKPGNAGQYDCDYHFDLDNTASAVNALANGDNVTLHFTVKVTDNSGTRNQDLNFSITGTNDKPEITNIDPPTAVVEDGSSVTTGKVTASDPDRDDTGNDGSGNTLHFTLVDGQGTPQILEGQYGRLEIIEGTGEYKYYLDNAKAQSLAQGQTGHDAFTVRVTDRWGAYSEQTLRIPITGQDDEPVLGNLAASVTEDNGDPGKHGASLTPDAELPRTVDGKVQATDVDALDTVQGFKLLGSVDNVTNGTVSGTGSADHPYVVQGQYGTLTFFADGSYTYTLTANDSADVQKLNVENALTDSFTIEVTTGHTGVNGVTDSQSSSQGALVITIQGSNDAPVISADYQYGLEVSWTPADGPCTPQSGQLVVTDADANETVDQNLSGVAPGAITSKYHSFYFVDRQGNLENPGTPDAGSARYQSATGKFGVLSVDPHTGKYVYTLNQYAEDLNTGGTERFIIWVEDGHGGRTSQEITVQVAAVPVPPVGPGHGYDLTGNPIAVTEDKLDVFGNDGSVRVWGQGQASVVDDAGNSGGKLYGFYSQGHFVTTVTGEYGTATIDPQSGTYVYVLDNSLTAVQQLRQGATLTETLKLWQGGDVSNVLVTITGTNDQPTVILGDPSLSLTQEDGKAIAASGSATVEDIDQGDTHTYWLDAAGKSQSQYYKFTVDAQGKITGFTSTATADAADYKVTITNDGHYTLTYLENGRHLTRDDTTTVSFEVYVKDDSGAGNSMSQGQTVTVTINGQNSPPTWGTLSGKGLTEDAFPGGDVTSNISTTGTFLTEGGVQDDTGHTADSGLSFSIIGVNGVHGGPTSLLTNQYGTLQITDARTGAYVYTLNNQNVQHLAQGQTLAQDFTIRVTDKHGGFSEETFTITITGTNDAPTLAALNDIGGLKATAGSDTQVQSTAYVAKGNDVDTNDTLHYSAEYENNAGTVIDGKTVIETDYGTFTLDQNSGRYFFTLDNSKDAVKALGEGHTKDLTFTVTVSDEHAPDSTASQPVVVHISGVNDAPVFVDSDSNPLGDAVDATLAFSDATLTGTVTATDVDGDTVSYSIAQGTGQYGTLSIAQDGTYTYTLHDDLTADDLPADAGETFTIVASDNNATNGTDTLELNISITGGKADPAPAALSLRSLFVDAPEPDDSEVFSSLLAQGESLDNLLGHAAAASAQPAVPAHTAQNNAEPVPLAMQAAAVELASPGGEEGAMARLLVENQAG